MASLVDLIGQSIVSAFGTSGADQGLGTVTTGPVFSPSGAPVPYSTVETTTQKYGSGSSAFTTGATRFTPTGFFETRSVPQAATSFYQSAPGQEVTSFAPGAADLWRSLVGGFLPTLRPVGQVAATESSGFGQGMIGQTDQGAGAGLPPLAWAGIAAGVVVLLVMLTKKR